jgi:hypothetical protein
MLQDKVGKLKNKEAHFPSLYILHVITHRRKLKWNWARLQLHSSHTKLCTN